MRGSVVRPRARRRAESRSAGRAGLHRPGYSRVKRHDGAGQTVAAMTSAAPTARKRQGCSKTSASGGRRRAGLMAHVNVARSKERTTARLEPASPRQMDSSPVAARPIPSMPGGGRGERTCGSRPVIRHNLGCASYELASSALNAPGMTLSPCPTGIAAAHERPAPPSGPPLFGSKEGDRRRPCNPGGGGRALVHLSRGAAAVAARSPDEGLPPGPALYAARPAATATYMEYSRRT
jgi:hypothetical protein